MTVILTSACRFSAEVHALQCAEQRRPWTVWNVHLHFNFIRKFADVQSTFMTADKLFHKFHWRIQEVGGGNPVMSPSSSHMQWLIQTHSFLKQHVKMINISNNTKYLSGNSAHNCQNAFNLCFLTLWPGVLPWTRPDSRYRLALPRSSCLPF